MATPNQLITNFYTNAVDRDFARDINFRVTVIEPGAIAPDVNFDENDLVYAKSGSVPARSITNVKAQYMGLNFNIPGVATYPNSENYVLDFYCDKNSNLRNKFESWSRATFNDANSTGNYATPGRGSYITLVQLLPNMTPVPNGTYKLVGASIRSVGELKYNIAGGTGDLVSFQVGLAYHYYEITS
jgi:hypothetical protein